MTRDPEPHCVPCFRAKNCRVSAEFIRGGESVCLDHLDMEEPHPSEGIVESPIYNRARFVFGVSASGAANLFRGLKEARDLNECSTSWICVRVMEAILAKKEGREVELLEYWTELGLFKEPLG